MSSNIAIKVENISKCYHIYDKPRDRLLQMLTGRRKQYYREFWALNDVSFEINKGETLGIVGRNGSGKSTLLQMICGTLNPSSGTIRTYGRIAALLELGSGFNVEFTGRENVYLNASVLGLSKQEIDDRFEDIIAFADIGDFIDQPVKTYSSGMFVRLAFAVVAHVDAEILIIDEALAVGDAFFTQKCMRFLRRFRETGTLIFVSHDAGAVTGLCDKAIWLNKGELQALGAAKLVSETYLASLYANEDSRHVVKKPISPNEIGPGTVAADIVRDIRADQINRSALRNDLQIFEFSPGTSADFGVRGAEIKKVAIIGTDGKPTSHVVGGELVTLRIEVFAFQDIERPIIGFSLKDRLGQVLFGDNTFITYRDIAVHVCAGSIFSAEFAFLMPILPSSDYSISAAIATGTQEDHIQHHWVHDAVVIKSISSSVSTGLVGIPMRCIELITEDK